MNRDITIVDRGRGPQLSTSRITVQDLVPYLQMQWSHAQIMEIMPVLTVQEIEAIEQYVREHYEEVMVQDRRIRELSAQRQNSPDAEAAARRGAQKLAEMREMFARNNGHARDDQASR